MALQEQNGNNGIQDFKHEYLCLFAFNVLIIKLIYFHFILTVKQATNLVPVDGFVCLWYGQ